MSKYTMQLRFAVLNALQHEGVETEGAWESDLEGSWPLAYRYVGLDDYPIFDEGYRDELNAQIIRHYYFQEIGQETLAQFAFRMRAHMHEVMPYYNRLYRAAAHLDEVDLWSSAAGSWRETLDRDEVTTTDEAFGHDETYTRDDTTTGTDTRTSTTQGTTGGTSHDETRNDALDLPMGSLGSTNDVFESGEYATSRERTVSDGRTTGTSSSSSSDSATTRGTLDQDGTRDYDETRDVDGTHATDETRARAYDERREPYAELFRRYRDALVDVDELVVQSCSGLFMQLF